MFRLLHVTEALTRCLVLVDAMTKNCGLPTAQPYRGETVVAGPGGGTLLLGQILEQLLNTEYSITLWIKYILRYGF